jgi:hypothetical protein
MSRTERKLSRRLAQDMKSRRGVANLAFSVIPAGITLAQCCFFANLFRRRRRQAEFGAFCADLTGAGPGMLLAFRVEP